MSVKRGNCDKMKEICAHILIPHERTFYPSFLAKRMVDGGDNLNFLVKLALLEQNADFSIDIMLV